ncbi:MAG: O-linked N-acetylglucosamine transferase, SPINDLY family protein [Panacagrimonas sp.]
MNLSRVQVLFAQAQSAHQQNRLTEAKRLYQQVLNESPRHADALHLLGLIHAGETDYARAESHLRKAVALQPKNPVFHNNLGECLRRAGKPQAAAACYETAVKLAPDFAPGWFNLGNVIKLAGRIADAERCYQRAIAAQPGYADAHYNLGNLHLELGRYRSAIESLERAIQVRPNHAGAHNNLGAALKEWDRFDEAIQAYRKAIELQPDFPEAHSNLAQCHEALSEIGSARRHFEIAIGNADRPLDRLHAAALCPLIPQSRESIAEFRAQLDHRLDEFLATPFAIDLKSLKTLTGEPPSVMVYQGEDDRPLKEKYARLFADKLPRFEPKPGQGRPRVGFVVTHGHEGVFLKCMRGIVARLPAGRFEVSIVCNQPNGEAILKPKIENPDVRFLSLPRDFPQAVEVLRAAHFDVLYWWEVGTDSSNYFLPFLRLAPVQCTSWGWPVTSGIGCMDYFVSCVGLEPEDGDSHYTEKLVRLEHLPTYYFRPPIPSVRRLHADFGFSAGQRVYFCQQNLRKVQPDFDGLVAGILRADPDGVVAFCGDKQPRLSELLMQRLRTAMPDVIDRVRMMPRMDEPEYLGLCAAADVILDTTRYGGGANTIYDAFAAGTPVVTLPTRFHRGRYALAAYRQIGLEAGVADSPDDYVRKAVSFATEPERRAGFSHELELRLPELLQDVRAVEELAQFFERVVAEARVS